MEATGGQSATGIGGGAGIGGGSNGTGSGITINGGIVTAYGGYDNLEETKGGGAGIGGGAGGAGTNITINGGTVTARGWSANNSAAAGIGGGAGGAGTNITINGGTVTATGAQGPNGKAYGGAGIGGGNNGAGSYITINGGTVTATGGTGNRPTAGIGGGFGGDGTNITITGGIVTATGGTYNETGGAGIGSGAGGKGSDITIIGGNVTATGGFDSVDGIGSGNNGEAASGIKVAGYLDVKADVSTNPPTTPIAHTGQDIAGVLAGKRYVTVEDILSTHTIVLKEGKAHMDTVGGTDITDLVAAKGLTYTAAAGETPATWTMNNFTFNTTAATALEFADTGTAEAPVSINIKVEGTNTITSGDSSLPVLCMYLSGSCTDVTIGGSGKESKLSVTSGNSTGQYRNAGLFSCAGKLTFKSLTAAFKGGASTDANVSEGIYSLGDFNVADGAEVTCTAQRQNNNMGMGLHCEASLKVTGTGELVAKCENAASSDKAVYATYYDGTKGKENPDVRAVDTDSKTELTWDTTNKTYKNGDAIATNVTLTPNESISVGAQTGTLTHGTEGSVTFNVTKIPAASEFTNGKVLWKNAEESFTETAPDGISVSLGAFSEGAATLTVTASAAAPAGTYAFKVTGQNGGDNLTSAAVTLTIAPKDISLCTATDLSAQNYTYNGSQITPEITVTDGSVKLSKSTDFTLSYGANKNAGNDAGVITIAGIGNYTGTKVLKFNINKAVITLSGITAQDKIYDGKTGATIGYSKAGEIKGTDVTVGYQADFYDSTGTNKDKNTGEGKIVKYEFSLTGSDRDNYSLNTTSGEAIAAISKKELSVDGSTANGKTYDGTTTAIVGTLGTLNGKAIESDDVSIDTATAIFVNKKQENDKDVIISYTLKGTDAQNYTVTNSAATADIEHLKVIVSGAAVAGKIYDGTTLAAVTAGSIENKIEGDDVNISAAASFTDANAGDNKQADVSYSLSGTDAENYTVSNATFGGIAITPRVTLRSGEKIVASAVQTDNAGNFTFGEAAIPDGTYTLILETGDKTVTSFAEYKDNSTSDTSIKVPAGAVEAKLSTSAVEAYADLSELADAQSGAEPVVINLVISAKEATDSSIAADAASIQAIAASDVKGLEFLDIHIDKSVNGAEAEKLTDAGVLVKIVIHKNLTGKKAVKAYRVHDGNAEALTELSAVPTTEEGYIVDKTKGTITLYVKRFSTYALGYIEESKASSGGGGGSAAGQINVSESIAHGKLSVDKTSASKGTEVIVTVTPDSGYTLETLVIKDSLGNEIIPTAVEQGKTYTFIMPSSSVSINASFMEENTMLNYFLDVKASDYFYNAVLWAAEKNITSGMDASHFGPEKDTTRAQMVTFLWRAAGSPEPTSTTCKFSDVTPGSYYEKAVLWAVEKGITSGISETLFAPDNTVTRAQTVTFLYRYEGSKAVSGTNKFSDVKSTDYYYNAVLWALENGITSGISETSFAPDATCTRGQIVTFLYRDIVK